MSTETKLNIITLELCDACLDGVGGECHVPGCAMIRSIAPDIEIRSKAINYLNRIAAEVHQTAIEHGWWDCGTCKGKGIVGVTHPDGFLDAECPTCDGSSKHRNIGELIALIHSEASEALEAARRPELDALCDKCDGGMAEPVMSDCRKCRGTGRALGGTRFGEELADVVIRVLDLSASLGLDIGELIELKHAYNQTRPHKHGGKAF